ncbi:MAG: long-chain fatty acid--CoA ligase [Desulfobacterales bacterium]|nr:MAG: long-chain fatty acid--CoA ligase [Desulfobacterales bacterium]
MSALNLPQYLTLKVEQFADRIFLRDVGSLKHYTYRDLETVTDGLAGALQQLGIQRGERVALLHPNHTDFILGYFAIIKAGAVVVPINPVYTAKEVLYLLEDCGACCLLTTSDFEPLLQEVKGRTAQLKEIIIKRDDQSLMQALQMRVKGPKPPAVQDRAPDDPAFIFYTSGTTGRPKGVVLTHRNLIFGGANTAQNYGLQETDVTIACLPLVHIFANASPVFGSLNSGGSVIVIPRFQTEVIFEAIEQYQVTWFPGVPTMFGYLLQAFDAKPRNVSSLRMGLSGGASLSVEHLTRFEKTFQATLLEVYGLTESTGLVTANPVYGVRKTGSIGISVSGVSVRLVDQNGMDTPEGEVGELIFRGPNASPGYWENPAMTAAAIKDGWVFTGDLARRDEDGYYFIVGRKDELIISGGYNIYPREIEEVLYQHEDIIEAAVVGAQDQHLGQVPRAYIALRPGRSLTAEMVQDFCEAHLAAYKIPKQVEIMQELPKNPTGKILKKALEP